MKVLKFKAPSHEESKSMPFINDISFVPLGGCRLSEHKARIDREDAGKVVRFGREIIIQCKLRLNKKPADEIFAPEINGEGKRLKFTLSSR